MQLGVIFGLGGEAGAGWMVGLGRTDVSFLMPSKQYPLRSGWEQGAGTQFVLQELELAVRVEYAPKVRIRYKGGICRTDIRFPSCNSVCTACSTRLIQRKSFFQRSFSIIGSSGI